MNSRKPCFSAATALLCFLLLTAILPRAARTDSVKIGVSLFGSAVLSEKACVMVGDRGRVFVSDDGAVSWRLVESRTRVALSAVCFPDDRNGWIAGQAGTILHSTDGGNSWKPQQTGVESHLLHVDFLDPYRGVAVGEATTVLVTSDGGATWLPSPLKTTAGLFDELNLFAAAMMDARSICVVGDMGRIFLTDDGGRTWEETRTSLYDENAMMGRVLYDVVYDSGTLYTAGIDSTFAFSKDRGKSWVVGDTGFSKPDLYCLDMVDGFGMAAGSGGHLIQTSDGGSTWREVDVPETVRRVWLSGLDLKRGPSGEAHGLAVGQGGTFCRIRGGAMDWR
jgi:photosystem II stability/assembly factor-like uncharacterized protein